MLWPAAKSYKPLTSCPGETIESGGLAGTLSVAAQDDFAPTLIPVYFFHLYNALVHLTTHRQHYQPSYELYLAIVSALQSIYRVPLLTAHGA